MAGTRERYPENRADHRSRGGSNGEQHHCRRRSRKLKHRPGIRRTDAPPSGRLRGGETRRGGAEGHFLPGYHQVREMDLFRQWRLGRRILARRVVDGLAPQRRRTIPHTRPGVRGQTSAAPFGHDHPRSRISLLPVVGDRLAAYRRRQMGGRRGASGVLADPALQPERQVHPGLGRAERPEQRGPGDHGHDDEPGPAHLREQAHRRPEVSRNRRGTRENRAAGLPARGRLDPARLRLRSGHRRADRAEHGAGLQPDVVLVAGAGLGRLRFHHDVPAHR